LADDKNKLDQLSGIVERVTFHSEESGFAVLRVKAKQYKQKELLTVTGTLPCINTGEYIYAKGNWHNDSRHGLQFKAIFIKAMPPNTLEGMEKYLASGLIKGIGPHFAKRLIQAFGENVFEIIETQPQRLSEVEGIGKIRAERIISSWSEQKIVREIMVFLQSHGVGTSKATRIYKTYGDEAINIVSENPYRLAKDIHGIGFLTADRIARNLGISENSVIRARAGINYVLMEALSEGHCGLHKDDLLAKAEKLLAIDQDTLCEGLNLELAEYNLVEDTVLSVPSIFLGAYAAYERSIARKLKELAEGIPSWHDIDRNKAISWIESKLDITLADKQKLAIEQTIKSKVTIITGGPGTGKTTLLKSLVNILKQRKLKILLCAPTGRAAKRLTEATGVEAVTIHRLLKFDPVRWGFQYNQDNLLPCDILVIDESSMVDVQLMNSILKALPIEAGLIIVGDVDQLPSVGAGQVLADLINSKAFSVIKLDQVFRQAQGSNIITNAYRINRGVMPQLNFQGEKSDFYFIANDTPEGVAEKVVRLVSELIPQRLKYHPVDDIQVLTPMQRGSCGAISLNVALQQALNPNNDTGIEKYGQRYAVGDKVMQTINNYNKEVYNGDIGIICDVCQTEQEVNIKFDDRVVRYDFSELDELTLAYAVTIHKSQGSEYPVVVIPITMQHYKMLQKNLLYTAVTRGKKIVILVGQQKAIAIAVKSDNKLQRLSKLKELLSANIS
jgi:exodeoxyribonuclease V alpha subunit